MVLMGSSLFFIYALPSSADGSAAQTRWARPLLIGAAMLLAVAALLGIAAQSSLLAGSVGEGLKGETLTAVVSSMALGKAAVARAVFAGLAVLGLLALKPGRPAWIVAASLGVLATASLAWMGHGGATEGALGGLHLASDILHALAAAIWIGALAAFFGLLTAPSAAAQPALHHALHGFSGIGSALVAVLVFTGLINSWILVGPDHLAGLFTMPYGQLLSVKLVLFVAMLGLAAANRFRHTPAFGRVLAAQEPPDRALGALHRSVAYETALGLVVLGLVAAFGTLPPPAAG
jgi:putative copper resistance protein D